MKNCKASCKKKTQNKVSAPPQKYLRSINAFLGWLGAENSFIIGLYLVTTCSALLPYPKTEHLLFHIYTVSILTITTVILLSYGSYLIWKGYARKGGITNLIAGIILSLTYTYYAILSQPPLLSWLGPTGFFLLIPAIMSGAISILTEPPKN